MLGPGGDIQGRTAAEGHGRDHRVVPDAEDAEPVQVPLLLLVGKPETCIGQPEERLRPRSGALPEREDVADPDAVAAPPTLLTSGPDPCRSVAGPLAQSAVLEEQHEYAEGAEPERDPEQRQDCQDRQRLLLASENRLKTGYSPHG